ncbi:hypothetical protein D3C71_519540 [compost metagenome]
MQGRAQGHLLQIGVEALSVGGLFQAQVDDGQGHVGGRHPDGVAGQLALELRQRLGHRLGGAGAGHHHVEGRAATASLALVIVVDEVLVVGVGVHRLHVAVADAELVLHHLEHRGDGVGGAGGGGDYLVIRAYHLVVDPEHHVLHLPLAGGGQQHPGGAACLEVLGQACLVAPDPGVVDDQRIVDAIGGVVDVGRAVCIDHLDEGAVGDDGAAITIHLDGAVEGAVHRVTAQQAGPLLEIPLAAATHDDGAQPQGVGGAGALDQQPGQQAADAAKAVEHHVGRGGHAVPVQGRGQLGAQVVVYAGFILVILPVTHRQLAEVHFGGGRVQGDHGLEQGEALLDGEGGALVAANDPVGLEDVDGGGVLQRAPVEGDLYPLLAVEATNQGLHGFGELLALLPRLQVVLVGH